MRGNAAARLSGNLEVGVLYSHRLPCGTLVEYADIAASETKKTMPGSAVPLIREPVTMPASAHMRTLAIVASSSGFALMLTFLAGLQNGKTRVAMMMAPAIPNCEITAINQLEARELPMPTPNPPVSTNDWRLL